MHSEVVLATVSDAPLDVAAHLTAVAHPAAGAVATFVGQVRDHDPEADGTVELLEYEAHPEAEDVLRTIATRVAADRRVRVAVSHRAGSLAVGDAAVVIAVASPHRALAFEVCRELIETIKTDLPIWKRQVDTSGRSAWKGIGDDQPPANGGSTSASTA
ncbi:MAG: molybdenum cofactor biosynthesis protein MoaE [Aeromicrobium sp.]|uniref:molybdenum cofactor biosynthesis protein MoaE n=1 Tax=Aeromicrobium sp. TaxID=1871063 RepID=UPI0025BA82CC|nr:molybdenum cofactor biosynthesis protein MoaE [Aeromicrobium sp.]MCK5890833.1 molybdenum cofactor biosynthesis protein MoaE [Aeromicrobium sp.]MDF1703197.1 molybdenum cofactor biosynthesis protein MoaE [Aeromicrobium sp.]